MKFKAPLITLGAGLVVAGVLYTMNVGLSNNVARDKAAAKTAVEAGASVAASTVTPSSAGSPRTSLPVGDGSGPAAQQGTVTYAGAVDGGIASLAIVVHNGKAIAYVCDGKTAEAWLSGTMANGQIELTGPKGSLKGTYGNEQSKGTVAAGAKSWGFTLKTAKAPSGLYRSAKALRTKLDASWVVLPDGRQIGVQVKNGTPQAAPPFDVNSKTATVDGTQVPIDAGDPDSGTGI